MKKKSFLIILLCAVALAGLVVGLSARLPRQSKVLYEVTFIPSLGGFRTNPHSLNDHGQVMGVAETPTQGSRIFLWDKAQGFRDLGPYDRPPHVGRLCLNKAGLVAGTTTDPNGHRRPFLWDLHGSRQILGTFGGLHGCTMDLNNKGQIVGYAEDVAHHRHAFIWDSRTGLRDLGTLGGNQSVALSVNDAGQVVGWSETSRSQSRLFLWEPDQGMTDLGLAGMGPFQCYINNRGFVVRRRGTPGGKT